jgi:Tfp pilus assembly protein PilE
MRWPRFTLRWMMMVVAIVGCLSAIGIEGERRRARFKARVAELQAARNEMVRLERLRAGRGGVRPTDLTDGEIFDARGNRLMLKRYRFAVRYPWLPVMPDLP